MFLKDRSFQSSSPQIADNHELQQSLTTNFWLMESKREVEAMFRFVEHVSKMFFYQACLLQWLIILYTLEIVFLLFMMYKTVIKPSFPNPNPKTPTSYYKTVFPTTDKPCGHCCNFSDAESSAHRTCEHSKWTFGWDVQMSVEHTTGSFQTFLSSDICYMYSWITRMIPRFSKSYRVWVRQ